MTTLVKIDRGLKTAGFILAGLAALAATGAGADPSGEGALIPAWLGVIMGFGAMVATFLASAPIFTDAGPALKRVLATVAGLCAAVMASTVFPQVQAMMSPHVAHRIASVVSIVGALAALVLKSPAIAGDAPPAPPPAGG